MQLSTKQFMRCAWQGIADDKLSGLNTLGWDSFVANLHPDNIVLFVLLF